MAVSVDNNLLNQLPFHMDYGDILDDVYDANDGEQQSHDDDDIQQQQLLRQLLLPLPLHLLSLMIPLLYYHQYFDDIALQHYHRHHKQYLSS